MISTASPPAMNLETATTTQLLDSLKDESNQEVWAGMDARYRPILEGVARRLGLPPEDAADVAQETLARFVRDFRLGKYERGKGRLRTWIMSIARHRSIDLLRARSRSPVRHGEATLRGEPSEEAVQTAWEAEEERAVYQAAHRELCETTKADPTTIRAFELTAVQGLSTEAAAIECGISPEQVRIARHRTTKRLEEIVARMTDAYRTDL
jgi:RNA polymerase sigma-70 factor (ECF subfamily)